MVLPYSDAVFLKVYGRECTETFWDGRVEAFEFFGGVPRRIVYENSRVAVSQIIGGKERRLTQGFRILEIRQDAPTFIARLKAMGKMDKRCGTTRIRSVVGMARTFIPAASADNIKALT